MKQKKKKKSQKARFKIFAYCGLWMWGTDENRKVWQRYNFGKWKISPKKEKDGESEKKEKKQ